MQEAAEWPARAGRRVGTGEAAVQSGPRRRTSGWPGLLGVLLNTRTSPDEMFLKHSVLPSIPHSVPCFVPAGKRGAFQSGVRG